MTEPYDWVDDDTMSAEETARRFQALNPQPTTKLSFTLEHVQHNDDGTTTIYGTGRDGAPHIVTLPDDTKITLHDDREP